MSHATLEPDFWTEGVVVASAHLLADDGVDSGALVVMQLVCQEDGQERRVVVRAAVPGVLAQALAEGLERALSGELDAA